MSTIALLNIGVKAKTSDFENGMRKVREKLTETKGAFEGFNSETLTSRSAIQTFAGITDIGAGSVTHLVHAFEAFPGPVGIAIGLIYAFKEAFEAQQAAQDRAAESANNFVDGMQQLQKALGEIPVDGKFATGANAGLESAQKHIDEIVKDISEHGSDMAQFFGLFDMQGAKANLDAYVDEAGKLMQVRKDMNDLSRALDDLNDQKFEIKIRGDDLEKTFDVLKMEAATLKDALRKVPEGAAEYRTIKTELQGVQLEMKRVREESLKAQEAIDKKAAEERAKADKLVADQFEASNKAMHAHAREVSESFELPLDKFKEKLDDLGELLRNGLIDSATFDRAAKAAKDATEKASPATTLGAVGSLKQIDSSLIDVHGLSRKGQEVQTIKSPQLDALIQIAKQQLDVSKTEPVPVAG